MLLSLLLAASSLWADEIVLKNGDRLKAEKIEETTEGVHFHHPVLGDMKLPRTKIKSIETGEAAGAKKFEKSGEEEDKRKKGDLILDRKLGAGYEARRGNTDRDNLNGEFLYNRNRLWIDEWTLKGQGSQEYSEDKKNTQRGDAMIRYAKSLNKKIYNFYRFGAEHDRFEGIDARLTPTTGLGYWVWDKKDLKLLGEAGGGYEYEFRREEKDEGDPVLQFRQMFSKRIGSVEFGDDIYYFPKLTDFGNYRIDGEVFLRFILTKHLALKLKAADQYRSVPVAGKKKNDLTFTSTAEWLF